MLLYNTLFTERMKVLKHLIRLTFLTSTSSDIGITTTNMKEDTILSATKTINKFLARF